MSHDHSFNVICPYCNAKAELASSTRVYGGQDYGMIWLCSNYPTCDAFVGVHKGTTRPLGRLANKELRHWKKQAHFYFDLRWKHEKKRKPARTAAYRWLATQLGISAHDCHIGMFDVETCKQVVKICMANSKKREAA